MTRVDIQAVTAVIRDVAASVILPRFRALEQHQISEKGPGDLVTIADHESEAALTARLRDLLPGSLVVGEEAAAADPRVLDRLLGGDPVWIVDPVDGTHNFAHGDPTFAVIVALAVGGATRAGWIHLPVDDETASAEEGSGAWIGDERLATERPGSLEELVGGLNFSLFAKSKRARALCSVFRECRTLRCSGREYVDMTRGRRHFAWYRKLRPWDHAAGVLMHSEAGGYSARSSDETPYRLSDPGTGLLVAPSRELWHRIRDHFSAV